MECWEGTPEETRSCFDSGKMPRREGWAHRSFQYADEGLVEGEPVLTPEGDQLVQGPSAMDSASTVRG